MVDINLWKVHLFRWTEFLRKRLDKEKDDLERVKILRELQTIENVRCAAILNPALILEFIKGGNDAYDVCKCDDFFFELNGSQKDTVRKAIGNNNLLLVQGPPGTGKTQVIAEVCMQLLRRQKDIKILVCSETHTAVNNVLSRIAKKDSYSRFLRIRDKENDESIEHYSPEKIIEYYLNWARNNIQNEVAYDIIASELHNADTKSIEKALILSANVVGMTCNRVAAYNFRDTTEMFDVAIIDEACKATLPELLAPLTVSRKAVIIGDPMQLPPVFCTEDIDVINEIEDCDLNASMYIDYVFNESSNHCVLDTQYRMTDKIGKMISDVFYDGKIINGRKSSAEKDPIVWIDYVPSQQWPPVDERHSASPRVYNEDECKIIKKIVEGIICKKRKKPSIALITPYKEQARRLREICCNNNNVVADTVDGFQGKESDIVIFSMTRTTGSFRFLADKRRLNVALSRARDKIYIVGNADYANRHPLVKKIMKYCDINQMHI